jgi:hypothetical protein
MKSTSTKGLVGTLCAVVVILLVMMTSPQKLRAVLIAYEPFDYPVGGAVLGGNSGIGFTGPWTTPRPVGGGSTPPGSNTILAGSLAGPPGLHSSGNHAMFTGEFDKLDGLNRSFPNIVGTNGTTTWISFLGQRVGVATDAANSLWPHNPYPRSANLSFSDRDQLANPIQPERISIGNSTGFEGGDPGHYDEWSLMPEGQQELREGPPSHSPKESVSWAVVRIDHVGDQSVSDSAWLWLNPDPLGSEPLKASANVIILSGDANARDYSGLDFLRPFSGDALGSGASLRPAAAILIDEIRIGTTWGDVRNVPEPTSALMLMLSWFAPIVCRGKRQQ